MDFSFNLPEDGQRQRRAFRTRVPGLELRMVETGVLYPVRDISAAGMAIEAHEADFATGQEFRADLLLSGRLFLGDLVLCVMRVFNDAVYGCSFVNMDARQEARLDKLVLEVQKRLILLKKSAQREE